MVTSLVIVQIVGTLIWLKYHSMSSKRMMSWQALFDFVRHAPCPSVQPLVHPPSWIHWQPPPAPFFKVNFDGKLFRNSKEAGLGVVVRDYRGRVQAFLPKKGHSSSLLHWCWGLSGSASHSLCSRSWPLFHYPRRRLRGGDQFSEKWGWIPSFLRSSPWFCAAYYRCLQ